MNAYDVLKMAAAMGLIRIEPEAVAVQVLTNPEFMRSFTGATTFDPDVLLLAIGQLVQMELQKPMLERADSPYPDYRVHEIKSIQCYKSRSGNITWKAIDSEGGLIYLRQADRELLQASGLWYQLDMMRVDWEADVTGHLELHTCADGEFRRVLMVNGEPALDLPGRDMAGEGGDVG